MDGWIRRFKDEALPLIKSEMRPEKILIFGSRARGDATGDSDVDVIIVSTEFEGIPFVKRMARVLRLIHFEKHVDAICYTPEEFERAKKESAIVMDAVEYAEVAYESEE